MLVNTNNNLLKGVIKYNKGVVGGVLMGGRVGGGRSALTAGPPHPYHLILQCTTPPALRRPCLPYLRQIGLALSGPH